MAPNKGTKSYMTPYVPGHMEIKKNQEGSYDIVKPPFFFQFSEDCQNTESAGFAEVIEDRNSIKESLNYKVPVLPLRQNRKGFDGESIFISAEFLWGIKDKDESYYLVGFCQNLEDLTEIDAKISGESKEVRDFWKEEITLFPLVVFSVEGNKELEEFAKALQQSSKILSMVEIFVPTSSDSSGNTEELRNILNGTLSEEESYQWGGFFFKGIGEDDDLGSYRRRLNRKGIKCLPKGLYEFREKIDPIISYYLETMFPRKGSKSSGGNNRYRSYSAKDILNDRHQAIVYVLDSCGIKFNSANPSFLEVAQVLANLKGDNKAALSYAAGLLGLSIDLNQLPLPEDTNNHQAKPSDREIFEDWFNSMCSSEAIDNSWEEPDSSYWFHAFNRLRDYVEGLGYSSSVLATTSFRKLAKEKLGQNLQSVTHLSKDNLLFLTSCLSSEDLKGIEEEVGTPF